MTPGDRERLRVYRAHHAGLLEMAREHERDADRFAPESGAFFRGLAARRRAEAGAVRRKIEGLEAKR